MPAKAAMPTAMAGRYTCSHMSVVLRCWLAFASAISTYVHSGRCRCPNVLFWSAQRSALNAACTCAQSSLAMYHSATARTAFCAQACREMWSLRMRAYYSCQGSRADAANASHTHTPWQQLSAEGTRRQPTCRFASARIQCRAQGLLCTPCTSDARSPTPAPTCRSARVGAVSSQCCVSGRAVSRGCTGRGHGTEATARRKRPMRAAIEPSPLLARTEGSAAADFPVCVNGTVGTLSTCYLHALTHLHPC